MSEWKARRFWDAATVQPEGTGWQVWLDARALKTPAKAALVLPTRALAEAIAAEWDAQQGEIDPGAMPLTRAANSAIDKVIPQRAAVEAMLADYGGTDLLCYRATGPDALVARQAEGWDPLLDWADQALGARLRVTRGIVPVAQDPRAREALAVPLRAAAPFALTALHDLVTLSGSLVLGLAVAQGRLSGAQGFALSRIDEHWQEEQWGIDAEARAMEAAKRAQYLDAERLLHLSIGD